MLRSNPRPHAVLFFITSAVSPNVSLFIRPDNSMPSTRGLPLLRLFILALSILLVVKAADPICYYPDGTEAADYQYVACNGSSVASCCIPAEGDACMSDGLCYWPGEYLYRGACTDQTWKSGNCPQYCQTCKSPLQNFQSSSI